MASRPKIPAALQRALKEEAGYRCAVPTCRAIGPFDFEHIEPWAKVKRHEEHNIVLLCVSCHARVTRGEIDKNAIKAYKRNLALINGRYSLFELRLIENIRDSKTGTFAGQMRIDPKSIFMITEVQKLHIDGLLRDGIISLVDIPDQNPGWRDRVIKKNDRPEVHQTVTSSFLNQLSGKPSYWIVLTPEGERFVDDYFAGRELD